MHFMILLGLPLLALATPHSYQDIYLELDPAKAQVLEASHGRMDVEPLLPAQTLEKLGLETWHRARVQDWQLQDADWLNGRPEIQRWEMVPDYRTSTWAPDDPGLRAQWHMERIGAVDAWQVQQGDPDLSIAIVDTGVNYNHEDLADKIWVNPGEDLDGDGRWTPADMNNADDDENGRVDDGIGWDFVNVPNSAVWPGEDGAPADNDPADFDGHGTHCAGDAAAMAYNGIGLAGPAARSQVMAIRAGYLASDGQGYVTHGMEGMLQALAYGAEVVSMSFGGSGSSQFWIDAANQAAASGMIMLAAAGNENTNQIHYPSGYAPILAVAATNGSDNRAGFSNYGDWVDLAAPGVSILSTSSSGGYAAMGGTSMACPVAAGAAALLKSIHPEWGGQEILSALEAGAHPMPGQGMGIGRINIGQSLATEFSVRSLGIAGSGRLPNASTGSLQIELSSGAEAIASGRLRVWGMHADLPLDSTWIEFGFMAPFQKDTLELEISYLGAGIQDLALGALVEDQLLYWKGLLPVGCGVTELLLVDGDSSDNWAVSGWYLDALAELGLHAEQSALAWESSRDLPFSRMEQILLFTGSDLDPVFDSELEDSLAVFLDRGGKLILSGQRICEALSPQFLQERAGAELLPGNMPAVTVHGVSGEPLTEGLQLLLIGSGGAGNQSDCQVLGSLGADPLFTWEEGDVSESAALRSEDGNLILCSFGLEGLNGDADWATDLSTLLGLFLDPENDLQTGTRPMEHSLFRTWPNPFNPALHLSWNRTPAGALKVFNLLGRQVSSLPLEEGQRSLTWQPEGLAAGVYILELPLREEGDQPSVLRRKVTFLQ